MLKLNIQHNAEMALELINGVSHSSIKSHHYYHGYREWFINKFSPAYREGKASILTTHCKTYNTLLGFCLLKHDEEVKISNLSPLVDGVGITQSLLDSCEFVLDKDYDIYIPDQASDLISKVKVLGFHHVEVGLSKDLTQQHKFSKPKNISWI